MLWKLKKAFVLRAGQVDILADHLASCRYPVILCGDFNDTPSSYTYRRLTKKLNDTYIEQGKGLFGATYGGRLPSFRIDYILHTGTFRADDYYKYPVDLSDHFPITATLVKKP